MNPEQRAFVEELLEDWVEAEQCNEAYVGADHDHIAARRAEFERLFPREGA